MVVSRASNTLIMQDMHCNVDQRVVVFRASKTLTLTDKHKIIGQRVVVSRTLFFMVHVNVYQNLVYPKLVFKGVCR